MTTKPAYVDLHLHTEYSDGTCTPREVVCSARWKGLDIIAITDHDCIEGYAEAREMGRQYGISVVPGVEFTTKDYHLLGLNFDPRYAPIQRFISESRERQRNRAGKRIELLNSLGIPITLERVEAYFPHSRIGKVNIMDAMLRDYECRRVLDEKHGYPAPAMELFKHYFGEGGAASMGKDEISVSDVDVIREVHNAGGIVVLAHPFKDVENISELDRLREMGLDGLEIQPNYYQEGHKIYEEYAKKNGMFLTYGSDFHGPRFEKRPMLGRGMNTLRKSEFESDRFESWLRGFGPPIHWDAETVEAYANSWGG